MISALPFKATSGRSIWSICFYRTETCGPDVASSGYAVFEGRSKWSHHQLGCSEHQTQREGHQAGLLGRCPTSRPLSGACVTRHCEVGQPVGGATEGGQQGALWDSKDRDPLKWVGLQLCGCVTPLEPRPTSTHHIWTPPKTTHGSTVAPRPRRCNPRVAVAACQTSDGGSPLVQTGSERDPVKPWGRIRLLEW